MNTWGRSAVDAGRPVLRPRAYGQGAAPIPERPTQTTNAEAEAVQPPTHEAQQKRRTRPKGRATPTPPLGPTFGGDGAA